MTGPRLAAFIRDIPNFPRSGVVFKDITPLLASPDAFARATAAMAEPFRDSVTRVVAIEARGFILGGPIAQFLGVGLVPIRKAGKLPWDTHAHTYELEYGTDTLEIHRDALRAGDRILVVDDVLATGGTAVAACALVEHGFGATVSGVTVLLALGFLGGRARLEQAGVRVETVIDAPFADAPGRENRP
jgi:adenine phosphoribosyltransferase